MNAEMNERPSEDKEILRIIELTAEVNALKIALPFIENTFNQISSNRQKIINEIDAIEKEIVKLSQGQFIFD